MPIKERRNTRESTSLRRRAPAGEVTIVDINDPDFLRNFVTEQGKILPQRLSGLNARQQRKLKRGVRRARTMGLMM